MMAAIGDGRCSLSLNLYFAETHSEVELLRKSISRLESDNELLRLEKGAAIDFLEKDEEKIKRLEDALKAAQETCLELDEELRAIKGKDPIGHLIPSLGEWPSDAEACVIETDGRLWWIRTEPIWCMESGIKLNIPSDFKWRTSLRLRPRRIK